MNWKIIVHSILILKLRRKVRLGNEDGETSILMYNVIIFYKYKKYFTSLRVFRIINYKSNEVYSKFVMEILTSIVKTN